ncbi:predicted protein [Naegleria gruberi]|uniref:Predicted protein n=1 Tax=Naegleria gruberi TaxID=5762 RepID=D2W0L7_NAEGR|nr:uncharacterized protein NAEGRDRAFT_74903 [Naegleria gruberi]EFC37311.1 predicted protein [Naegleria gruberi]|eukprot:XP_002670055.1 predicted protein [Naegleria gruberi strain NEG-M]
MVVDNSDSRTSLRVNESELRVPSAELLEMDSNMSSFSGSFDIAIGGGGNKQYEDNYDERSTTRSHSNSTAKEKAISVLQKKFDIKNLFNNEEMEKRDKVGWLNSIRFKTLTILLLLFFVTVLACLVILIVAFHLSYTRVEYNSVVEASVRVSRGIHEYYSGLYVKLLEYAPWDSTLNLFVNVTYEDGTTIEPSPELVDQYFTNNIFCSYMSNVNLSLVALYYLNGTKLRSMACFNSTLEESLPEELENLSPDHYLIKDMSVTSTRRATYMKPSSNNVNHSNDMLMLVAMPVLSSDYSSESGGVMVFGRYQNADAIHALTTKTQLCISFYNYNSSSDQLVVEKSTSTSAKQFDSVVSSSEALQVDVEDDSWVLQSAIYVSTFDSADAVATTNRYCYSTKTKNSGMTPEAIDGERMSAYQIMSDINGEKTILVRTDMSRKIYTNGINSFLITWGVMTVMLIILSVAVMAFIELVVLRRMVRLTNSVVKITNNWETVVMNGSRIPKYTQDEIGRLANRVNLMLGVLEKSYQHLQKDHENAQSLLDRTSLEEQKYRQVLNAISDFIITIDSKDGKILNYNTSFQAKIMTRVVNEATEKKVTNKAINEYFDSKPTMQELLGRMEDICSGTAKIWETNFVSRYNALIPIHVNCSKVKIVIDGGEIVDAFVLLARNMADQYELQKTIKTQQEQFSEQRMNFEFDYYWKNKEMKEKLRIFCINEKSYENCLFLEEVEAYRKIKRTHNRVKKQQEIIAKFLTKDAKYELNISKEEEFTIVSKIRDGYGQIDLLDKLFSIVRGMFYRDTFQRFLKELDQENESTTSSSGLDVDETSDTISSSTSFTDFTGPTDK